LERGKIEMKIIKSLLIGFVLFGCSTTHEPRLIGTFVSDKDATMAYLEGSGKFTERQLKTFSRLLGKLKIECDGITVTSTLDDYTNKEPLKIIKSTDEYALIEYHFLGEPTQSKVIFTEDGYWEVGGIAGPNYREKFVRVPTKR
jgi:hypothetical protein